eukprot:409775_1
MPFGGKLPRVFITLQNTLIEKYGAENAEVYFRKIVTMIPVMLLIGIASLVSNFIQGKLKQGADDGEKKGKEEKKEKAEGKSKKSKG